MGSILILAAVISTSLLAASPGQAAGKAGLKCVKLGATNISQGKSYKCVKFGKYLFWNTGITTSNSLPSSTLPTHSTATPTPTPTPTPILGSISLPVPMGSSIKVGDLTYSIKSIDFSVDAAVCAGNRFNDGCGYDADLNPVVDPASKISWAAVNFSVGNSSMEIQTPDSYLTRFNLVFSSGQLLQNSTFIAGYPLLTDLQILPGGVAAGAILFEIPKSASSLKNILVIRNTNSIFNSGDYYFQLNW